MTRLTPQALVAIIEDVAPILIGRCPLEVRGPLGADVRTDDEPRSPRRLFHRGLERHRPSNPARDIELVEAIRKEVGDRVTLMVDSNCGYGQDVKQALRIGRALEEHDILWFEGAP